MSQTRIRIPALYGGISQQPPHLRAPNQVQSASNALFDVFDGVSKRPGSRYVGSISGLTLEGDYRLHAIVRDHQERYLALYGEGDLRVFEILDDGTMIEANVTISSEAQSYLDDNSPSSDDLRLVTVADYTMILNRTVAPAYDTNVLEYEVDRQHKNESVLKSYAPLPGEHHRAVSAGSGDGYFRWTPANENEARFARWNRRAAAIDAEYLHPSAHYRNANHNPMGFRVWFRRPPLGTIEDASFDAEDASHSNAPTITKVGAFADYTFEDNDWLLVQVHQDDTFSDWAGWGDHPDIEGAWFEVESRVDDDTVILKDQQVRRFRTTPTATGSDGIADHFVSLPTDDTTIPVIRGVWKPYNCEADFTLYPPADMYDVALKLQEELRDDGAENACVNWRPDETYQDDASSFEGKSGASPGRSTFEIVSPYRGSRAQVWGPFVPDGNVSHSLIQSEYGVEAPFGNVGDASEYRGLHTDGTGSNSDPTLPIDERWETVPPPNDEQTDVDARTMPMRMRRTSWTGDGSTPAEFDVDTVDWAQRQAGTATTNPLPQLLRTGTEIADISFHDNRLVLAGGEYMAFSQAGDYFNFFHETPDEVIDSDPIDLSLTSNEVTLIDFVSPFRDTLLIFTKAGRQFELNVPELLTPTTATITPSTSYRTQPVRPKFVDPFVYFLGERRDAAVLYEYFYDDTQVSNRATDATGHVPGLVPKDIRTLDVSPNDGAVFVIPHDCNKVYIYRAVFRGNEKVQAAWSTWAFATNDRLADMAAIRSSIYLLFETQGQCVIEEIPIKRQTHL